MIILITGASSGIGKQLAIDYLDAGHKVYCCGRNQHALKQVEKQFPDLVTILNFEVNSLIDCKRQLESLELLDLAILNAGTCEYIDAINFDAELFSRVVRVNLEGTANCLQYLIPKIKRGGSLALMGSSSSFVPLPRAEAYGASKAAIEYLARTLRISLKSANINVTYIAPGFVKTPLTDRNDFPMPMLVDVNFASTHIRKELKKRTWLIHFPRNFTWLLKIVRVLPTRVQHYLIAKTLAY
ncbi:MAG: short-chain dehydrogenase [Gammaproteobacteria bacterium]|nr:short-chain dehydrogenase [Gammaproteobacteria bacterium]|tara:strand:+ start:35 stop:757 length:723 start_codon:yes stop_codon:yes gene_type:complete